MRKVLMFLAICVLAAVNFGCASTNGGNTGYVDQPVLRGNAMVIQGGQKNWRGTSNAWTYIQPLAPDNEPDMIPVTETYERNEKEYKSKCGNPNQNRDFKFKEVREKKTYSIPNPGKQTAPPSFASNGNPGFMESVLPALISGAAAVGASAVAPGTDIALQQIGGGATIKNSGNSRSYSKGGTGVGLGGTGGTGGTAIATGGKGGDSSSSSSSSSSAAAAAAAAAAAGSGN